VELAYHGSFYENSFASVRWESPFLSLPGAEQGALAEAPDNDYQQLALTAQYRVPLFDSRLAFSAALGRGTQDQPLLPYTTNANLAPPPLPAAAADAEVDATHLAMTVVSAPLPRARVRFSIRYDERDNATPRRSWSRVIADSFLSGESELNVPYSFERLRTNLSGDYELNDAVRVSAGYDYMEFDRTFQEVADQSEDSGWARLRWRPGPQLELGVRGGISRRDSAFYDVAYGTTLGQNPLLRKFNLAYRYRQFGELSVSAAPSGWPVTLAARASWLDDRYTSSPLGLTDSEEWRYAADIAWTVSAKASVYIHAGVDEIDRKREGSEAFAAPDWLAMEADRFYSIGGGLRVRGIGEKADLELDYARGRGTSAIDMTSTDGPSTFPDLESTLDSLRMRLLYRWSERLEGIFQLRFERLPAEDWALEGVAPDTLPTVLTLGAMPYDDEVWMAGFGLRYRMGGP
jgi:MtrB/PioB family decaheme-associated outer membrane protein